MLFQGLLTLILFALAFCFFYSIWYKLFKSKNLQIIDKRITELQQKKKQFEELKKAVDIQEKINNCEQEINKLDLHYKNLLRKN